MINCSLLLPVPALFHTDTDIRSNFLAINKCCCMFQNNVFYFRFAKPVEVDGYVYAKTKFYSCSAIYHVRSCNI